MHQIDVKYVFVEVTLFLMANDLILLYVYADVEKGSFKNAVYNPYSNLLRTEYTLHGKIQDSPFRF